MKISSTNLPSQTITARKLKFWEKVHIPPPISYHVSNVMCHVSQATCHISHITCHISHVKFFLWGSVINGATPSIFYCSPLFHHSCNTHQTNWFNVSDPQDIYFFYFLTKQLLLYCCGFWIQMHLFVNWSSNLGIHKQKMLVGVFSSLVYRFAWRLIYKAKQRLNQVYRFSTFSILLVLSIFTSGKKVRL